MCLGETSEDVQSRLLDNLLAWMGEDLFFSRWKTLQGTICTTVWLEKVVCKAKLAGLTVVNYFKLKAKVQTLEADFVPTGKCFDQSTKPNVKPA